MEEKKCIFCDIISGKIPAQRIAENEEVLVIRDIHPKAPVHYLIIPKVHVRDIASLSSEHMSIMTDIAKMAQKISNDDLGGADFRLVINNGPGAGQSVFHLHCHFLSGKKMTDF